MDLVDRIEIGVVRRHVPGSAVTCDLEKLLARLAQPRPVEHRVDLSPDANRFSAEEQLLAGEPLVKTQEERRKPTTSVQRIGRPSRPATAAR